MRKRDMIRDVLYPSIFMMIAVVAATMATMIAAALLTGVRDMDAPQLRAVPLIASAVFYVVTLISQRRYFRIDEMRFGTDAGRIRVPVIICSILLAMAAADLLETLIHTIGLYQIFPHYKAVAERTFEQQNPFLLTAVTMILAPLAEEMMFRGMTYRRARHYMGTRGAILISALLFGLYHMNMIQFLFCTAIGVMLAWLYEQTGTLLVPILSHAAANAWELFLDAFVDTPGRLAGAPRCVLLAVEAASAILLFLYLRRTQDVSARNF